MRYLLALLLLVGCSTSAPRRGDFITAMNHCTDALDKQSEAIKHLENVLDVTAKQRDELLKLSQEELQTIKKQNNVLELYKSEYAREHSVPVQVNPPSGVTTGGCVSNERGEISCY